jgi:ankyrin repeat protein
MLKRNLACVDLLMEKAENINANIKDDNGDTLLGIAIESMNKGNYPMIKKLLKNADPNIPDANGNTPLIKLIKRIVEKRKSKNKSSNNAFKLEIKVAKKLLSKGADPAFKNKGGENAINLIMETGSYSTNLSKSDRISELIHLLWKGFSFVKNPESFFTFNKNILSPDTQNMILSFIEKSLKEIKNEELKDEEMPEDSEEEIIEGEKEGKLPNKVINTLDDEGYTPFLRYIR